MSVWFDGSIVIDCTLSDVRTAFEDPGAHYAGLVALMPGLTTVELLDQGPDFVTIRTNEGTMKRTNITLDLTDQNIAVEFDEEYDAGRLATARAHFREDFSRSDSGAPDSDAGATGVTYRLVISNMEAPGFLGFFYRNFGSRNIGKAFLGACQRLLEGA